MIRRGRPRSVRVAYRPARARYRTRAAASVLKPLILIAAGAAVLAWGAGAAREAWGRAAWTRVRGVTVVPAALQDGAPPDGLERAAGISAGDSLFGFSSLAADRRLRTQFPELEEVRVRRTLEGRVRIVFRRRRAAAKVWDDGQWLGMDEEGGLFPLRVFVPEGDSPGEDSSGGAPPLSALERNAPLPILSGVPAGPAARPALAFLDLFQRLPQPWAKGFYKMKLAPSGEAALFFKDGPLVRWGEVVVDEGVVFAKADRLERVLRDPRLKGGAESVRFVDDRRLAVKPKIPKESS